MAAGKTVAPMTYPAGPFDKSGFAFGILFAGTGLYFALASFELVPLPGGRDSVNGPMWLLTCAGVAFGLAGVAILIRASAGATDAHGELPAGTSKWLRLIYALLGPAIVASLAAMGTWVAFGPGEREISFSMPFFSGPSNEWIGRAAFGFGAIITWLMVVLMTRSVVRKVLGREKL